VSREKALADAAEEFDMVGPDRRIVVGRVKILEPKDYVHVDIDTILEITEERVYEEFGHIDNDDAQLFDFAEGVDSVAAVAELKVLFADWVSKYLENTCDFWVLEDEEEVTVPGKKSDDWNEDEEDDDEDDEDDEDEDDEDDEADEGDDEDEDEEDEETGPLN
jgi:hypothetical protein